MKKVIFYINKQLKEENAPVSRSMGQSQHRPLGFIGLYSINISERDVQAVAQRVFATQHWTPQQRRVDCAHGYRNFGITII